MSNMFKMRTFTGILVFGDGWNSIERVIFNDPATIVMWKDGTKTVVKCQEGDTYDEQTGLLMCIAKKHFGNTSRFNDVLHEWVPQPETNNALSHIFGDVWEALKAGVCTSCQTTAMRASNGR